jgi:hypothetical protein
MILLCFNDTIDYTVWEEEEDQNKM